jgi:hypothetical protein
MGTTNKKPIRNSDNAIRGIIAVFWLALLISACGQAGSPIVDNIQPTGFYRPPTPQPALTGLPAVDNPVSDALPTPIVSCEDQLVFLSDVTITDGTVLAPDSTLDKRWEVENRGNCNWNGAYRLRLVAGPALGVPEEQALYPARSGTRATIRMVLKAPMEPGIYLSAWQAFNPDGEPFGDVFFINFAVE